MGYDPARTPPGRGIPRNEPHETYQEDDRYGQANRGKGFGYPKGNPSKFIDGRHLPNPEMVWDAASITVVAGATVGFARNVYVLPEQKGLYVGHSELHYYVNALDCSAWLQLWAGGKFLHMVAPGSFLAVDKYLPPQTTLTAYARIVNSSAVNQYFHYVVNCVAFDASGDIWSYGRGCNAKNPATYENVTWPDDLPAQA